MTATTTSAAKVDLLAGLGADGVVMDGRDTALAGEAVAVAVARPDVIVNQMTGLSQTHAGKLNPAQGRPVLRRHQQGAYREDGPPAGRGRGGRGEPGFKMYRCCTPGART